MKNRVNTKEEHLKISMIEIFNQFTIKPFSRIGKDKTIPLHKISNRLTINHVSSQYSIL